MTTTFELRLFATEATEYDLLSDVQKSFEPYCDLWKRVDDWMTWHKGWMNDSFLSLDAEEVKTVLDVDSAHILLMNVFLVYVAYV